MVYWRFRDYVSPVGTNKIKSWYKKLPSESARTDFDVLLEDLAVLKWWLDPSFKPFKMLKGSKYQGLGEIRYKTNKVQHRVIGFFSGGQEFTMLLGCTHKQRVYKPANALDTEETARSSTS